MKTQLPLRHVGSPLWTNAALNRKAAIACFEAGMTAKEIAAEWPLIWKLTDGKLVQKYDFEIADGSGRFETNRRMGEESVAAAILRQKNKS